MTTDTLTRPSRRQRRRARRTAGAVDWAALTAQLAVAHTPGHTACSACPDATVIDVR